MVSDKEGGILLQGQFWVFTYDIKVSLLFSDDEEKDERTIKNAKQMKTKQNIINFKFIAD